MTAADVRVAAREAIHTQFARPALYTDADNTVPVPLNVRWHGQNVQPIGDFQGAGYAQIVERTDRLIFLRSELADAGLSLNRKGVVAFPDYGGASFNLDVQLPADGPVTVIWTVTPVGVIAP